MHHSQTPGEEDLDVIPTMSEYYDHCTSSTNVYVRLYDSNHYPIEEKRENVFLWHDGNRWIFSNYNCLHFMVDYGANSKKKWLIKPETSNDNILCAIGNLNLYGNDLNITKQCKRIIFRNSLDEKFQISIQSDYGWNYNQHLAQFMEDPLYRNVYALWRENLDIIYSKNQLFSLEQLKDEEMKHMDKNEADETRKYIEEINDI